MQQSNYRKGTRLIMRNPPRHLSRVAMIELVGSPFNGPVNIYSVGFDNGEKRLYSHKELEETFVISNASQVLFGE